MTTKPRVGGGVKALVDPPPILMVGPLKKELFFAASLSNWLSNELKLTDRLTMTDEWQTNITNSIPTLEKLSKNVIQQQNNYKYRYLSVFKTKKYRKL